MIDAPPVLNHKKMDTLRKRRKKVSAPQHNDAPDGAAAACYQPLKHGHRGEAGGTFLLYFTAISIARRPRAVKINFPGGELSSGVQHFFWRGKVETLSGSIVEHLHHFFHFLGRDLMEVGPSREELPYETIQVLNRRFLPG